MINIFKKVEKINGKRTEERRENFPDFWNRTYKHRDQIDIL